MESLTFRTTEGYEEEKLKIKSPKIPDSCPICHIVQRPKLLDAFQTARDRIEIVFKCTSNSCNRLFISRIQLVYSQNRRDSSWLLRDSYPVHPRERSFESEIIEISPAFVEIYNQAKKAEENELNHVAGMGYRKSLEFLIKDFLIKFRKEEEDKIKATFLGNCIKTYLTDNIRRVAERATWLGNDETHYHRVWENKDISDLKKLIDLTVYYVSSEIQTQKIIEEMDKKNKRLLLPFIFIQSFNT